ncbi:MAG: hypothetical protein DRQ78_01635 [Epsilonproteobacteria bacterium]|nr:MAG: hypothetical protein DRQ78_01635 [Campylobacterota bacterium]
MKKILLILGLAFASNAVMAETVATVNGMEITLEEANKALEILSKGKETWEKFPAEERKQLISMMAPAKLVTAASKTGLTEKEKEAALAGFWMQKKMSETLISDKEAEDIYNKLKEAAKKANSTQQIPEFSVAKNSIKMKLAQEKIVAELMKAATIVVK